MRIDIVTIFPELVELPLSHGIVRRARQQGLLDVRVVNLRDHAEDRHRTVDDTPFGGGGGMVLMAEPILRAVEAIGREMSEVVMLSPQGAPLDHARVAELARLPRLVLVCGRYEGVDERVRALLGCSELSVGDFVMSGGELAACIVVEAVTRLLPGALGCAASSTQDSFFAGFLDHPHYTRPTEVQGLAVPDVLKGGDHAKVDRYRRREALRATITKRPDLLVRARVDRRDRRLIEELSRSFFPHGDAGPDVVE